MTLKLYLWGMRLLTVLALIFLALVLKFINPQESGIFGLSLFYGSLFVFLSCFFILSLTAIRRNFTQEIAAEELAISFRQGILIALFAVILLFLQSFRFLVWWDGLLVLAGILVIELYFLSKN